MSIYFSFPFKDSFLPFPSRFVAFLFLLHLDELLGQLGDAYAGSSLALDLLEHSLVPPLLEQVPVLVKEVLLSFPGSGVGFVEPVLVPVEVGLRTGNGHLCETPLGFGLVHLRLLGQVDSLVQLELVHGPPHRVRSVRAERLREVSLVIVEGLVEQVVVFHFVVVFQVRQGLRVVHREALLVLLAGLVSTDVHLRAFFDVDFGVGLLVDQSFGPFLRS